MAVLCAFGPGLAAAMPINDYVNRSRWVEINWIAHSNVGILAGRPAMDPIMGHLPEWTANTMGTTTFTLDPHQDGPRQPPGDDFFQRLSSRDLIKADAEQEDPVDRSDVDIAIDLESFTREAMSNTFERTAERLGDQLGLTPPEGEATPQQPLTIVPAQMAPPGQDVPLLSAMQLGTMAVEVMGPEVQQVDVFGHSIAELNELRKYMLVSEPVTGGILMVDAQQQSALAVNNAFSNHLLMAANVAQMNSNGKAIRPSFMEERTLVQRIWDFFASQVAMVLYGILIVIWMTWRYLLRKYV